MTQVYHPFAIRQEITAGNDFDGTAPGTTPVFADLIQKYPTAAKGGLFNPYEIEFTGKGKSRPVDLIAVELSLADQTAWTLSKVDPDSKSVVVYAGTAEGDFVTTVAIKLIMLPGSTLKLVTTGATLAMTATLTFDPHIEED